MLVYGGAGSLTVEDWLDKVWLICLKSAKAVFRHSSDLSCIDLTLSFVISYNFFSFTIFDPHYFAIKLFVGFCHHARKIKPLQQT